MSLQDRVFPEEIDIRTMDNGRMQLHLDGEELTSHQIMSRETAEAHARHPYVLAIARQTRLTAREYKQARHAGRRGGVSVD